MVSHHKSWTLLKAEQALRNFAALGIAVSDEDVRLVLTEYDRLREQERDMILLVDEHARLKMVEETARTLVNLRRNPGNVRGAENLEHVLWDELWRLTR